MTTLVDDLQVWLGQSRRRIATAALAPRLEHIGRVAQLGDGVATVIGLPETRLDELLVFEGGVRGLALDLGEAAIGVVLLGDTGAIAAGSIVRGTGEVARVPVGEGLLGRVVDALGLPLDGGEPVAAERLAPVEQPAPAIVDRALVTRPLATGLLVVDAMIPLGRGQRELIIGDRGTGKTAIAVDAIINQRSSDVICVYAAIGQKASSVAQVIDAVRRDGAPERCLFVVGEADAAPGLQWLTPYSACTMAEHFMASGRDVLLVIDDLTKHAAAYRQISLLLRRPPGREAYPGDIFYIHSRLLERAAKLAPERGGGSLTALPIAETQAGNISAYIPTNLISITDGQIYLDPRLFYEDQKPAVDVGKSVSRVGGKTQAPVLKPLSESLRLEYAQFLELEVFTRFGTMVDERTRKIIEHGRRIRAVLRQPQFAPLALGEQVALLVAVSQGVLDDVPLDRVDCLSRRSRRMARPALSRGAGVRRSDRGAFGSVARTLDDGPRGPGAFGRRAVMTRLADIEAHIGSMGELLDIVGAMRSLAGMRVQEAHRSLPGIRRYAATMAAAIGAALLLVPEGAPAARSAPGRRAIILCTTEHGFVGAFNERLLTAAEAVLDPEDLLFILGSRGVALAQERGRPAAWTHPMATRPQSVPETIRRLTAELYRAVADGEVTRVETIFARYHQGGRRRSSGGCCSRLTLPHLHWPGRGCRRCTTCRLRYCWKG